MTPPAESTDVPAVLAHTIARLQGEGASIAVIGLGYVGLPLALELCRSGADVVGIDVSEPLCAALNEGRSHVGDISDAALAQAVSGCPGRFHATVDPAEMADVDAVVICVPTPLRKSKDPDISFVVAAVTTVSEHARPGQLVVLESTTYPGTTEEILVPMLAERGLRAGRDIGVAFSPERVDPGNPTFGIRNTPKVVGGVTPACAALAEALYGRCCDHVVKVSSPAAAEMTKLLENVFRSVNIGLANEFALICRELGLDVWEVVDAAATKPFGFMRFVPGPGLGGHCIPVDPHYLAWKLRGHNYTARFVELADAINSRMPEHVVRVVTDALNDRSRAVRGSRVLVLGVAYKRDISDVRESPALDVLALLEGKGAVLQVHDPFVPTVRVGDTTHASVPLTAEAVAAADCVVLLTDHTDLDLDAVLAHASLVVDSRNAMAKAVARAPEHAAKVVRI
jgi:UDP-N-acetyl-D-glucosamine dehydrogenase